MPTAHSPDRSRPHLQAQAVEPGIVVLPVRRRLEVIRDRGGCAGSSLLLRPRCGGTRLARGVCWLLLRIRLLLLQLPWQQQLLSSCRSIWERGRVPLSTGAPWQVPGSCLASRGACRLLLQSSQRLARLPHPLRHNASAQPLRGSHRQAGHVPRTQTRRRVHVPVAHATLHPIASGGTRVG
jgi:hypothetical protein